MSKAEDGITPCRLCKKPVSSAILEKHLEECAEKKKKDALRKKEKKIQKQQEAAAKAKEQSQMQVKDKDGSVVAEGQAPMGGQDDAGPDKAGATEDSKGSTGVKKPPKKSATKTAPGDKKTKKRKADAEAADKEPKKKKAKKDDDKAGGPKAPKAPKPKGPVNVEIQCGVSLGPEKEGFCARSLTCKSHSMGLKRSVPGRSLPYDQLLANYQKKNQAKQQKALMEAQSGAHLPDEEDAEGAAVDSDEEKEAVMKGLSRWKPRPLEQIVTVGLGRRYKYIRLKEALGSALAGAVGQRLFGVPTAPGPIGGGSIEGLMDGLEMAAENGAQRAMSITSETSRRPSMSTGVAGRGAA